MVEHLTIPTILILLLLSLASTQQISAYLIDSEYHSIDGSIIPYSNFNETHLLVNAMQTTCAHCIDQHFELQTLYDKNISGIEILSLSVRNADTLEVIQAFNDTNPTPWHFGIDIAGNFAQAFSIASTPTLLFFNQDGELLFKLVGTKQADILENQIYTAIGIDINETSESDTSSQLTPTSDDELFLDINFLSFLTSGAIGIIIVRSFRKA